MKNILSTLCIAAAVTVISVSSASAVQPKAKPWYLGWWQHEMNNSATWPHKSAAKHYHPDQWRMQPAENIPFKQRETIISEASQYGFIKSLGATKSLASVRTGPLFHELAFPDQQFLMRVIATHYDILNTKYRMFVIRDGESGQFVGTYTRYGLQIE